MTGTLGALHTQTHKHTEHIDAQTHRHEYAEATYTQTHTNTCNTDTHIREEGSESKGMRRTAIRQGEEM